jgi:peroxiredoxin
MRHVFAVALAFSLCAPSASPAASGHAPLQPGRTPPRFEYAPIHSQDGGAAQAPDPKKILRDSAEACRAIKSIEYEESQEPQEMKGGGAEGGGAEGGHAHHVRAAVRQARAAVPAGGFLPGKFSVEGAITHDGGGEARRFAYSYDGKTLRVLDAAEKLVKVVRSPSEYVTGGLLGDVGMTGVRQFTEAEPFKETIERAERVEYAGTTDVHGVACHVVAVTTSVSHPALGKRSFLSRWFVGVEDRLPRGREYGGVRQAVRITRVNGALPDAAFVLQPPRGFGEMLVSGREPKRKGLLAVGTDAPGWRLQDPRGRTHALSDYRGRLVLLDFWGTWCVPCLQTMPAVQSIHEKFKDRGVAVFGVTLGGDEAGDPVAFMKNYGFTYNLLLKGDEISALYNVGVLPALYLVGDDGKIIHAEYGVREGAKEDLTRKIDNYLKARGR